LILADTSVWIEHLRAGTLGSRNNEMREHLNQGQIVIHPFIIAELALGLLEKRSLRERAKTLALLDLLPQVRVAQMSEVRLTIEARRLYSLGIGLTDAHLIASVFINPSTLLWTRDKRLRKAAEALGIHASLA
jgi:predicted nucleic acid-binding protein